MIVNMMIPESSPSLNRINGKHWSYYYELRKHWAMLLMVAKNQAKFTGAPWALAKVSIVREGKKLLDHDNLVGGCKVVIDGLKANGMIVDDSPAHMQLEVSQRISRIPRTLICLSLP